MMNNQDISAAHDHDDDGDHEYDEEEEFVGGGLAPLVREETPDQYKRRRALEIAMRHQRRDDEVSSCWGDTWRLMASLLLATALLGPWIVPSVFGGKQRNKGIVDPTSWPNEAQCAKDLQVNFTALFDKMTTNNSTVFCETEVCLCLHVSTPWVWLGLICMHFRKGAGSNQTTKGM